MKAMFLVAVLIAVVFCAPGWAASVVPLAGSGTCCDGITDPIYAGTVGFSPVPALTMFDWDTYSPTYSSITDTLLTLEFSPEVVSFYGTVSPVNATYNPEGDYPANYFLGNQMTVNLAGANVVVFGFEVDDNILAGGGLYTVTFHGSEGDNFTQQYYVDSLSDTYYLADFAAEATGGEYIASVDIGIAYDDYYNNSTVPNVYAFQYTAAPEPATFLLIGAGLLGAGVFSKRFRVR